MATLNTLRTKGGVFLSVIIGISLLAFLLGDLASSGNSIFSSSRMNVGEVNGETVSYQDYEARIDELGVVREMLSGGQTKDDATTEAIRSQAWEQLVRKYAFDGSLDNLGLGVSDEESIDMATGNFVSPILTSLFIGEDGRFDKQQMAAFVANLDADESGRSRFLWTYIEKEMLSEREMSKMMALTSKGFFVTELETEQAVEMANVDADIRFVSRPINTLVDSTITATDAEMRAYYEKHKQQYKRQESRDVEYVVYDVLPSQEDYITAQEEINRIAQEFKTTEDVKQFVNLNSETPFNGTYFKASELSDTLAKFTFKASIGEMSTPIFEADKYVIARLVDLKNLPDSIEARQILLPTNDKVLADSLVAVLKKNKSANFDELVVAHSLDKENADLGRFNPSRMINETFALTLSAAAKGDVFAIESPYGIHVMEVTYRGELFPKAQLAIVDYTVEPSEATRQMSYAAANELSAAADRKGASLTTKAEQLGGFVRVATLGSADKGLPAIGNSREAVRWAWEAVKNDVSSVISTPDANIVVRLDGITEHGYAAYEAVKGEIKLMIIREKRLQMIADQMKGATSLDELASKNNLTVKEAQKINFDSYYIPELGLSPIVVGAVNVLQPGVISTPIITNTEVVVVEVISKTNVDNLVPTQVKVLQQTAVQTDIQARVYNAVLQSADVRDNRVKFF